MIQRIPLIDGALPAERNHDVTASVIGCLWGVHVHPYMTVFELYNMKRGLELPREHTEVTERGNDLEPIVAIGVQRKHPEWCIRKCEHYYRDPEQRIGATPDYFIDGDPRGLGVLQCKTVAASVFKKTYDEDSSLPPFWILLQVQTELLLTGAAFGIIGVRVVGDHTWRQREYVVPRHEGAQQRILATVHEFWEGFDQGIRPRPDYERDQSVIEAIHPHDKPGIAADLRDNNRIYELLEIIEANNGVAALAKKVADKARAEVMDMMGEAAIALVRGWRVTWKTERREAHYIKFPRVLRTKRINANGRDTSK